MSSCQACNNDDNDNSALLDLPPSYSMTVAPPSYEDVSGDVPPEYTGVDAPVRAHIFCGDGIGMAEEKEKAANNAPLVTSEAAKFHTSRQMDLDLDLEAPRHLQLFGNIDWSKVEARECVSKKKKQEQKRAQQVRFRVPFDVFGMNDDKYFWLPMALTLRNPLVGKMGRIR